MTILFPIRRSLDRGVKEACRVITCASSLPVCASPGCRDEAARRYKTGVRTRETEPQIERRDRAVTTETDEKFAAQQRAVVSRDSGATQDLPGLESDAVERGKSKYGFLLSPVFPSLGSFRSFSLKRPRGICVYAAVSPSPHPPFFFTRVKRIFPSGRITKRPFAWTPARANTVITRILSRDRPR